jgi:formiminoglutamase
MQDLRPFFTTTHFIESRQPGTYESLQWGAEIQCATQEHFDWENADFVLVGCGEWRGEERNAAFSNGPDMIREQLYQLFNWHPSVRIADAGNIVQGATLEDSRAALRLVLSELHAAGKIAIVLGGSHDLTLQQYEAFKASEQGIHATVADMLIDLDEAEGITSRSFLMDMLTAQPNYIRHYSHLGFQSYHVHPRMLETLDKLRFDFFRLGKVRESMEEAEPVLRSSDLFSFDMNAVRFSDAPVNRYGSPNGFTGDEACALTRYAGMSERLMSFGIYGYDPVRDVHRMTAKLIAQMIWYFIDGYQIRLTEAATTDRESFAEFHVSFTSNDTTFLRSKRTGRWWMQMPDRSFAPCSYKDYLQASNDEIPERWLRAQERLV